MARTRHDIVIIGGGAAGLTAAAGCAQLGMKTALIEKDRMGGDCLYHGCVPSKTLLKTAGIYAEAGRFPDYGLPEIPRLPEAKAQEVFGRVKRVIETIAPHDSPERFRELGVEVILDQGRFVSEGELELGSGDRLTARNFVVASGSSPAVPPIPGLEEAGYVTNREIFSLEAFPKSLIILGAGPIGVEMAQAFARLGSRVSLVDRAGHVLPREDEDMAGHVERSLERDGVELHLSAQIEGVEKSGAGKRVHLAAAAAETEDSSSGKPRTSSLEGAEILVALGRRGNTAELGLEAAGVELKGSFIAVDKKLRSSNRRIRAAGDVNGQYLFTHVAGAEGSFLVKALALHLPGSMDYSHVPWCTYSDPELASIGYNEMRAREAGIEYKTIVTSFSEVDRAHAEGFEEGVIKTLLDKKERIIGVQIAAGHAGELLLPSILAVQNRWKLSSLMKPMYPYPTMGEIHKRAAGNFLSPKLFNPRVRRIVRVLFGYRGLGDGG